MPERTPSERDPDMVFRLHPTAVAVVHWRDASYALLEAVEELRAAQVAEPRDPGLLLRREVAVGDACREARRCWDALIGPKR